MTYTEETLHQLWNDKTGERTEIGPDRDGLDLVEIRNVDSDGKVTQCVTLTAESAAWIGRRLYKPPLPEGE